MKTTVLGIEVIIKEIVKEYLELKYPEIIGTNWTSLFNSPNLSIIEEQVEKEVYYRTHLNRELYCLDSLPDGVTETGNGYFFKITAIKSILKNFDIPCPVKFKSLDKENSKIPTGAIPKQKGPDNSSEKLYAKDIKLIIDPVENTIVVHIKGVKQDNLSQMKHITGKSKIIPKLLKILAADNLITRQQYKKNFKNEGKGTSVGKCVERTNIKLTKVFNLASGTQLVTQVDKGIMSNMTIKLQESDALNDYNCRFNDDLGDSYRDRVEDENVESGVTKSAKIIY